MFDARDFGGELLAEKSVEERRGDRDGQDTQRTLSVPGLCDLLGGFDYGYVGQYDGELSLDRSRLFDRGLYVSSDFEEYVVPGPIEPDPDQPGDSGESDGSEK